MINNDYNDYDVVIMGGGMAGLFLGRQLKKSNPDSNIIILEKSSQIHDWKVGEATVEIACHYIADRLNLTNYLNRKHLTKNGLRYFFDNEDKDLPLEEMSEIGTWGPPPHSTFLFDRKVLEEDFVEMNRSNGVEVLQGAIVKDFHITQSEGEPKSKNPLHQVTFLHNNKTTTIKTKWLIDATGRKQTLLKKLKINIQRDKRLKTASIWGRFSQVKDIDQSENTSWRKRVNFSSRMLSTMHFMNKGYWIWVIPLPQDIYSIGVVYDKEILTDGPKKEEDFVPFLKKQESLRSLLENSQLLDCKFFNELPYYSGQYFSENRWAVIGDSSAFLDPFYSPGSDFIAIANDMVASLISTDHHHNRTTEFKERVQEYNTYYKNRYERLMKLYVNNYQFFGSYELINKKYFMDLANYYSTLYWPYLNAQHLNLNYLKKYNEQKEISEKILDFQQKLLEFYAQYLNKSEKYYANNHQRWQNMSLTVARSIQLVSNTQYSDAKAFHFLNETYALATLQICEEIYNIPGLGRHKFLLKQFSLINEIENFQVDSKSYVENMIKNGLKSLKNKINREFSNIAVEEIIPRDDRFPLKKLQIKVNAWEKENTLLYKYTNKLWQESVSEINFC